ncbi:MAG: hypothetical protein M0Z31_13055 [Clostridia bacterium]|nr:hypothetical protein [Clostridia bacterium]
MPRTGLIYSNQYLDHVTSGDVESPARLKAIMSVLKSSQLWTQIQHIDPYQAPLEAIAACHSKEYLEELRGLAQKGGGPWDEDTSVGPTSFEVARLAAGGALAAVDGVMEGTDGVRPRAWL